MPRPIQGKGMTALTGKRITPAVTMISCNAGLLAFGLLPAGDPDSAAVSALRSPPGMDRYSAAAVSGTKAYSIEQEELHMLVLLTSLLTGLLDPYVYDSKPAKNGRKCVSKAAHKPIKTW